VRTRPVRVALLTIAVWVAACAPAAPRPHDTGRVTVVHRFAISGRLYVTKSRRLYRFAGTTTTALSPAGLRLQDPAATLDGATLAYAQLGQDSSVIEVSDPELANPHPVTDVTGRDGSLWAFTPSFASDGRSLAYLTDRGKQGGPPDLGIWRYDLVRHATQRLVTPYPYTGGDADPSWRPTGDAQLLYVTYLYAGDPPAPAARLTWYSPGRGRDLFISPAAERNFQPAWSPDGRFVAYIRAAAGSDDLYVMAVPPTFSREPHPSPTESATLLQSGTVAQPVWAPDGSALAFLKLVDGSFDLYVLPVATDGTSRAAGPPVAITSGSFLDADSRLAWSP
jgi:Tol biopolymer transport system component